MDYRLLRSCLISRVYRTSPVLETQMSGNGVNQDLAPPALHLFSFSLPNRGRTFVNQVTYWQVNVWEEMMRRCAFFLSLVLLGGHTCHAQSSETSSKQEIVELAHKADVEVFRFAQANQLAQSYISQAEFDKGVEYTVTARKAVAALSKNPSSAYTSTELLIVLNELALDAATHARAIYQKAMGYATTGRTIDMNELAAADSFTKAQSTLTEVSELLGHSTLGLIATDEKSNTK
jgi:hypothetical protein